MTKEEIKKYKRAARGKRYYLKHKVKIAAKASEKWLRTKDLRTDEEKAILAAKKRAYRLKNKDKVAQREREYRALHKEQYAEHAKKYKRENKDKISAASGKYYKENSEKIKVYQKEYNKKNKEKVTARKKEYSQSKKGIIAKINSENKRRHTKKALSDNTLPLRYIYPLTEELQELLDTQKNKCNDCRCEISRELKNIHLDHHIPLCSGGTHSIGNVVWLCAPCNMRKHNKLPTTPLIIKID